MEEKYIHIKNAEVNNLKGIDLDIPRDKFVVITGISGSGKSSLAFETLFAEGQRRFAESLSSFARQFLGRMTKPAVESITGIPPAIAVEQKVSTRNPRSTVGSVTEIYDYLRVLFARIGRTYSPESGREVRCDTTASVSEALSKMAGHSDPTVILAVTADIKWHEEKMRIERIVNFKEEGFTRLFIFDKKQHSGEIVKIETLLSDISGYGEKEVFLFVDRYTPEMIIEADEEMRGMVTDSINTAFDAGKGHIAIASLTSDGRCDIASYSNIFEADGILFEHPSEWMFNYNNPLGACTACGGFGKIVGIDESLVIPNQALSIYEDAIACWKGDVMKYFKEELILNADRYSIPIHLPYKELSDENKNIIWNGAKGITGILPFFKELESKKYKIQNKYMISRYSGKTTCRKCGGSRLRKESLYVKVGGKNIAELLQMSIKDLILFFDTLKLDEYSRTISSRALSEIRKRLGYIENVGLSYLTLSRASNTLSGGESQRINLAKSIGNTLTGSMYILDEPSIGLHDRDTSRLIGVIRELRDLGNTVIVVEHDEAIIKAADYIIDIGPLAGRHGGRVVYAGPPLPDSISAKESEEVLRRNPDSLTLQYLTGARSIGFPDKKRESHYSVTVYGACENNLKNIDVQFPLNVMTAVIGVSGSGKSTLVGDILYPALNRHINQIGSHPGSFTGLKGDLSKISSVEFIDQNPIGKSSRSNPVTYIKAYDDIRKLFSEQPYAKMNGYGHSHFSFNIDGGRCPQCLGEGVIKIPMQFMADITMTCESCGGRRFKEDILEVKYHGKDICDILDMSVDEAIEFFSDRKEASARKVAKRLQPLHDVGLGYIALGQSSSTLSGGESQRVKLAYFLGKEWDAESDSHILFIFDEPTTGLHFDDIRKLLDSFSALLDRGHTIIVVEHNPYIIKAADHIIELGPEGGEEGGYLIRS